ncbi:hypothetical protein BDAP_001418 [Binucleata daphniae]
MNTYKTIFDEYQLINNKYKFLASIKSNTKLFNNHILSVNWLRKLQKNTYDHILLHNVETFYIDTYYNYDDSFLSFSYVFFNREEQHVVNDENILAFLNNKMLKYYDENGIVSNQKIFENEDVQKYKKYIRMKREYKDAVDFEIELAFTAMIIERSQGMKIPYIAKSSYYKEREQTCQKIELSKVQNNFLSCLKYNNENNMKYEMDFDVLRMFKPQTALKICLLAIELDYNIKQLTVFTKKYVDDLFVCIKKKHIKAISSYHNDLQSKKEKQQAEIKDYMNSCIDKINAITSINQERENTEKNKMYCNIDIEE